MSCYSAFVNFLTLIRFLC